MANEIMPQSIGKYELQRIVGKGAMGTVYEAFDQDIERRVALKILHSHLLDGDQGDDYRQRFVQEAKAAARCLHPNIVTVFDFGEHEETPYIVMEYVNGVELKDQIVSGRPFSLTEALGIVSQILEALSEAHSQGVVHRDIKPANIMLMDNGRIKVSDFGVARLDNFDLTNTGMMVGTPNYMSPEGLNGAKVDSRSDLYSVGVLLFELITQQRPFRGVSLEEALAPLDQCSTLNVSNAERVKAVLQRALQPQEDHRFQQASDFLDETIAVMSSEADGQDTVIYQPTKVVRLPKNFEATFHPDVLLALENSLLTFVGPAAKMLVKKYSKQSSNLNDLSDKLAKQIPDEKERLQFLNSLATSGIREISLIKDKESQSQATKIVGSETDPTVIGFSPEMLQSVTQEFAFYVGPLASRLVNKVFKQTESGEEFYQALAAYIPDAHERQQFLNKFQPPSK